MNKNIIKTLAIMATTVTAVGVISATPAHAERTTATLDSKISTKINKMEITNRTDEEDFEDVIDECLSDYSGFSAAIIDFEKEKATREESGYIKFDLIITDDTEVETTRNISVTIGQIGTNVYIKLPEIPGKYLAVNDSYIIEDIKAGEDYDSNKYYVTDTVIKQNSLLNTGWNKLDNDIYYIEEGKGVKKGWCSIDTYQYHLDEVTGKAHTMWEKHNGKWYFMDFEGKIVTGFKTIDNVRYYLTEPIQQGGDIIYTNNNVYPNIGSMATGWKKINNNWYCFKDNGSMITGWVKSGNNWYFMDETGVMAVSTIVGGYNIGEDGAWTRE